MSSLELAWRSRFLCTLFPPGNLEAFLPSLRESNSYSLSLRLALVDLFLDVPFDESTGFLGKLVVSHANSHRELIVHVPDESSKEAFPLDTA